MATTAKEAPVIVYTNGSNPPTRANTISESIPTKPKHTEGKEALPPVEKKRKSTRASTLLSTLAPPFTRRLGRARSLTNTHGEPVTEVQEVLKQSPPPNQPTFNSTEVGIGGEPPSNGDVAAPQTHDDERTNELERTDTFKAELAKGESAKGMRRLSRRLSDAGALKVGSAIGSIKRKMGLGKDSLNGSTGKTAFARSGESIVNPAQEGQKSSEGPIQDVTLSLPKEESGKVSRRSSFRERFLRPRAPATDTFAFAASAKQTDGSIRDDHSANLQFVESPVTLQDGDGQTSKRTSLASNRPRPSHAASAPAAASIRSSKKEVATQNSHEPNEDTAALVDMTVPRQWLEGTDMYKISEKGKKTRKVILDPDQGFVLWESKKSGIIRIENIKEMRVGADARFNMQQLNHPEADESKWLTITYLADQKYKALHLVARNSKDFQSFYDTLRRLRALRLAMLSLPSDPHLPQSQDGAHTQSAPADTAPTNGASTSKPTLSKLLPIHTHTTHKHLTNEQRQSLWERHHWKGTDSSADGRVDFKEIKRMAHRLSMGISSHALEQHFKDVHRSGGAGMNLEEFRLFWRRLGARGDIQRVWRRLLVEEKFTFPVFEQFMRMEQKDTRSREELEKVFLHYATTTTATRKSIHSHDEKEQSTPFLSMEGFTTYLMSSDNAPFKDQHLGVYHDMNRPLSEYYISSSHNTYLIGNQLVGDSTIEGYIRALLSGCRCVEIDIYDGEKEPVITHGGTLTSKISLRVICEAIEKSAFVMSPYPVIISAEVHCGVVQQEAIAVIMKECFGEKLVDQRIDGSDPSEPLQALPSPQMLMYKILLKTKNPTISQNHAANVNMAAAVPILAAETDGGSSTTSDQETNVQERRGSTNSRSRGRKGSRSNALSQIKPGLPDSTQDVPSDPFDNAVSQTSGPKSPKIQVFSQALANLLVYTVGVKFRGINKKEHYAVEHMFSLSEKKTDKMLKEGGVSYGGAEGSEPTTNNRNVSGGMLDLIKHAQTHLVRTYPKGTRLKSTNYLPHRYWAAGAQLVAINWQTSDLGCMINHAMFLRNGRSGYVLKPASLRPGNHKLKDVVCRRKTYELDITIISGQQIPRPRDKDGRDIITKSTMDPYVHVSLYIPDWPGAQKSGNSQGDSSSQVIAPGTSPSKRSSIRRSIEQTGVAPSSRYALQNASTPAKVIRAQTDPVKNNGFNPDWQSSLKLKFEVAADMLDLVFIRFCVRDEGDDEDDRALALYCTSLGSLKQGYRHLPLHDQQMSQYLFATLFVHTNLREIASKDG